MPSRGCQAGVIEVVKRNPQRWTAQILAWLAAQVVQTSARLAAGMCAASREFQAKPVVLDGKEGFDPEQLSRGRGRTRRRRLSRESFALVAVPSSMVANRSGGRSNAPR